MRRRLGRALLASAIIIGVIAPAAAFAYPRPGITDRVSVSSDGTQANAGSIYPAISADSRYVAFSTVASNLVPGDTNRKYDIFVRDQVTGVTERVSVASDGAEANNSSDYPALSADGRYVAFFSYASNLVPGDTNFSYEVFVHDRDTDTTERVSVASDGAQANSISDYPAISADGRYVAFESAASNLVPGDTNGSRDVFVHDRSTKTTERVSVSSDGAQPNSSSFEPAISADGRHVVFSTPASNLVAGDTNGVYDVFVHDRDTGVTERVSMTSDGAQANASSVTPTISADGQQVAFQSYASNLVPGDTNGAYEVFVRDRSTGATERVSVASDGREANSHSYDSVISANGRHVAFWSLASSLDPGDNNAVYDVFVHDRATQTTERVSVTSDGAESNARSIFPAISAGGEDVAFYSLATNLVRPDTNGVNDVFVHDRGGPLDVVGELSVQNIPAGVDVSGRATFSGTTVTEALDPHDDGTSVVGASNVGAELTGAAVIYRPEQEDLLVRLELSSLPPDPVRAGVVYGTELQVGETRFEVRALEVAATADPPASPYIALYRCDPECTEDSSLTGSFGTTGNQVLVSVPLSAVDAGEGTELTGLRAFTATGEATPGRLQPIDDLDLPSSTIPASRVELGIADSSTPEEDVVFTVTADPSAGDFSATIPAAELEPGSYRVWARACLGETCGRSAASSPLAKPAPNPTAPAAPAQRLTMTGHIAGSNPVSSAGIGITENEFIQSGCRMPPQTQGADGYVVEIPPEFGTGTGTAFAQGVRSSGAYNLDLAFYSDCEYIDQVATVASDEIAEIPPDTGFLIVNASAGVDTDFTLTLTAPPRSPSPVPTSPSPTATPTPTESPVPEQTAVSFTEHSATGGQYSDEALFEARLTDSGGDPIAEQELTFELAGADSARTFTDITDDDGVASVTPTLDEKPGTYQLTVRYAGDDAHDPSADTTTFVIDKEDTDLELTVAGKGKNRTLTVRLSDRDTASEGITNRTIDFYADGESIGSATTNSNGVATLQAPPRYRGGKHDFEARFEGDDSYLNSSDRKQT